MFGHCTALRKQKPEHSRLSSSERDFQHERAVRIQGRIGRNSDSGSRGKPKRKKKRKVLLTVLAHVDSIFTAGVGLQVTMWVDCDTDQ